jgi:hypothetical protein
MGRIGVINQFDLGQFKLNQYPHSADIDSIAFLVSHCAQSGEYDVTKMSLARKFVMESLNKWRQPAGYKIPQGQVLEAYNLDSFFCSDSEVEQP